ncbi:elongation factor Ts [Patescibacteria group bacterium]|nr:elongation factor Ts [Patescibacteria group bacterium]
MNQKIIIEKVKKIREETGLSVMQIKKAVEEAKGDEKKAKEILLKMGLEKVKARNARETKQGRVATYTHNTGKIGAMVELLCETDFVARNESFMALASDLCLQMAAIGAKNAKEFLAQDFIKDGTRKVGDLIDELNVKFGEKIVLGRFERFEI